MNMKRTILTAIKNKIKKDNISIEQVAGLESVPSLKKKVESKEDGIPISKIWRDVL